MTTDRRAIAAQIQARHEAGARICDLSREFSLPWTTTRDYAKGTRFVKPGRRANAHDDERVKAVKRDLAAGVKPLAVAVEHDVAESTVRHWKLGTRRKDVAA